MNPDPLVRAMIDLARAQLKLGALITEALLGLQHQSTESVSAEYPPLTNEALDRAAVALQIEMLKLKEMGLASLLRTNFPPAEIRRIAQAVLDAADRADRR
jgi:hypothetical protein